MEPSLLYTDGVEYLKTNKRVNVLYLLMEIIGKRRFNRLLMDWVDQDEIGARRLSTYIGDC
ncbi:hypothetical protein [Ulvibacterium sp.]|uniref:hypothetical protein n=1 Tax=Ulvibacterium sp. TaxID=2665914 RepID=UPI003CC62393